MKFDVVATDPFARKLKQLAKKYKSLKVDLAPLFISLADNPIQGVSLGKDCYKIRMAITSKGKGKSGGARIITYVRVVKKVVFLIDIYNKSQQDAISERELKLLLEIFTKD